MITPNTSQVRAMAGRKRADDGLPVRVRLIMIGVMVLGVIVTGIAYANF